MLDETSGGSSAGGANLNGSVSKADGKDTGTYRESVERHTSVTGKQTRTSHPAANGNRTPRRKNGRSAVPSWDEIIFGE